jgi:hypothetical protein
LHLFLIEEVMGISHGKEAEARHRPQERQGQEHISCVIFHKSKNLSLTRGKGKRSFHKRQIFFTEIVK